MVAVLDVMSAVTFLRERGYAVTQAPGSIPGLWIVNDYELTIGQVIDFARKQGFETVKL